MSNWSRCPSCRTVFSSDEADAGQKTICPVCGQPLAARKPSPAPINKPLPQSTATANLPQAIPVAGLAPPDADEDLEEAPRRRSRRSPKERSRQTPAAALGIVAFVFLCLLVGMRFLLFMMQWEKANPAPPARILPKMEGKWASGADRIDIGGEANIDNRGYTKFIMLHDGKLVSGALQYQNEQTGHWMKTIKPEEEEIWRFRFDKTVGQLTHNPRQDALTVMVDGKTQVFQRKPDAGQQEGDLANALLDEPLAVHEQPDPPAKIPFAVDPKLLEGNGKVYLSDLKEFAWKQGWGGWGFGKNGKTSATPGWGRAGDVDELVRVKRALYPKALAMQPIPTAYTRVCYALGRKARELSGAVAFLDRDLGVSPVRFVVLGDGKMLWRSPVIRARGVVETFSVDAAGVDMLELRVYVQRGDGGGTQAVWLDPYVTTK
jgi:NPCBM/NEW2 domain